MKEIIGKLIGAAGASLIFVGVGAFALLSHDKLLLFAAMFASLFTFYAAAWGKVKILWLSIFASLICLSLFVFLIRRNGLLFLDEASFSNGDTTTPILMLITGYLFCLISAVLSLKLWSTKSKAELAWREWNLRKVIGVLGALLLFSGAVNFFLLVYSTSLLIWTMFAAFFSFYAAARGRVIMLWLSGFISLIFVFSLLSKFKDSSDVILENSALIAEGAVFFLGVMISGALLILMSAFLSSEFFGLREKSDAYLILTKPKIKFDPLKSKNKIISMPKAKPRIDWSEWNIGGRIIFISSCFAFLSFLLPWVDIGFASRNGFSQGSFLLGCLYIYPVYKLLTAQAISKSIGFMCSMLAIIGGWIYYFSKEIEFFGDTVNAASIGVGVFIISAVIMSVGISMYEPSNRAAGKGSARKSINEKLSEKYRATSEPHVQDNRIPCPQCAELIMPNAKICRFCKSNLNEDTSVL